MFYDVKRYENFKELFLADETLARELNKALDLPNFNFISDIEQDNDYYWQNDELLVFKSIYDYVAYELTDGMYGEQANYVPIYANLKLADYVNIEDFGRDLLDYGDQHRVLPLSNGKVVVCEGGF